MAEEKRAWWKETVIYQIYTRSFQDSDGNGIGDLEGILSRVDYIDRLGAGAVWLNPIYASPDRDNGYDISDYWSLDPKYGSMDVFEELIRRLHEKGIRLIMDMVINHSSDQHEWFRQARTGRDNAYYHFYHWWPAEKGEPPYRLGLFDPQGKGWHYNAATDSWYLHYFSEHQPDLNWENPEVRLAIYDMMRFWLKKGVDGFRMDAVTFISKDTNFPPFDPAAFREKYRSDWGPYYADGPNLHEYLREIREVLDEYGAVAIAEAPGVWAGDAIDYVGQDRRELDMLCHFEGISIGYLPGEFKKLDPAGYSRAELKKVYSCWNDVFATEGWGTIYLGNHDQPRMVSRWGNDSPAFREISAKMLFCFLLTMRATPFIYHGDELGMTNIRFRRLEEYEDIETKHVYQQIKEKGGDTEAFLRDQQEAARDNSRTPFQWDGTAQAGFTTGKPWLRVNENYTIINREAQEKDAGSVLHFVRQLVRLRKENPVLVYGDYQLLKTEDAVYVYTRTLGTERLLVAMNFSEEEATWMPPDGKVTLLVNNYRDGGEVRGRLRPYQALIYRI